MAGAKRDRPLSELEGCVLGHLEKHGGSTAYAVRQSFLHSPSSHWSGSAGAVYPALARLETRGLVKSVGAAQGGRQAWRYSLTPVGRRRFFAWLEPPFLPEVLSVPPDPLRTRMSFLDLLSPARRAEFVDVAIDGLRRHLETLRAWPAAGGDECLAHDAAQHVMRARIAWLEGLRRRSPRG